MRLRAQIPEVDAVLGTGEVAGDRERPRRTRTRRCRALTFHRSSTALAATRRGRCQRIFTTRNTPRLLATPKHYAYCQNRRRMRLQVPFCIISDVARRLSEPHGRVDLSKKRAAWRPRRQGTAAHSRRTPRSTGSTAASGAPWHGCFGALMRSTGSNGFACSICTNHHRRRNVGADGRLREGL
jgi:hypothetical protein